MASSSFQRECAAARYRLLEDQNVTGGRILEVGCGAGIGLSKLRERGARVVGVELDPINIQVGRARPADWPLAQATAEELPLRDDAVTVAGLLEVVYYLDKPSRVVAELARVTAPGGRIVITWPDPRRSDFIPSPFATRYPEPDDVVRLLAPWCDDVTVSGLFPLGGSPLASRLRTVATKLHLVPRSLRGRARIKRLLQLRRVPVEAFEIGEGQVPTELVTDAPRFIMLYAVGTLAS